MNQSQSQEKTAFYLSAVCFWASALVLLFMAIGQRGLWGPEGRWAEIVREMFLKGDFFHPTINGLPYFDKPLFTYWVIAAVTAITGSLNEWAVRVPSAIAGLATLWSVIYLGKRLWSRETGMTAGWILLTVYGFLFWSRTGAADIENMAFIMVALAWYWARRERPGFTSYLIFYLICFIGSHFKGLTALAVPLIAIFPDMIRNGRWKSYISWSNFAAAALGLGIYLLPFIYASITAEGYSESGLKMVFQENIQRFFKPFDHKEPAYVYFYYLPLLFLPWTPLLLTALGNALKEYKRLDKNTKWVLEAIILVFLFFTISGSRRSYYILPAFPFCALLTSAFIHRFGHSSWKRTGLIIQSLFVLALALIETASPAIWPLIHEKTGFIAPPALKVATLMLGLAALIPLMAGRIFPTFLARLTGSEGRIAPLIISVTILAGGFFCWQQTILEVYRTQKPFLLELKAEINGIPEDSIAMSKNIANVAFYLDMPRPIKVLKDEKAVKAFLSEGTGVKIIIARRKDMKRIVPVLPEDQRRPMLEAKTWPWLHKKSAQLLAWKIEVEKTKRQGTGHLID